MNMNFFNPDQCVQIPAFYNTFYSQLHTTLVTVSRLRMDLDNTQNAFVNAKKENESLKAIIKDLENKLQSINKASESSKASRNEEKGINPIEGYAKKTQINPKIITIYSPCVKEEAEAARPESQSTEVYENSIGHDSAFSSPNLNLKLELGNADSEYDEGYSKKTIPIRRRNGFKPLKESESESKKDLINKAQRSRAKHLWITYGRKIVEYASKHSKGALREKIAQCNKLISKKGYSEVFLLRTSDNEKERDYKTKFGRLALDFLGADLEDAFLSSNYREELLAQKEKVKNWIKKQIKDNKADNS